MMQPGAIAGSLGLHVLIVVALSLGLLFPKISIEPKDVPQVIAVDLVAIGAETVIKPPEKEEVVEETPPAAPIKPKKVEEPIEEAPPEEQTVKQEAAAPEEVKETKPALEETPEPVKEEPELIAEEQEKVDEEETLADLARLIDRSKEEAKTSEDLENDLFATFGKTRRQSASNDSRAESISLTDAARSQVAKCWNLPLGGKNVESMRVTVNVLLAPDGAVVGAPTLDAGDRRRMQRSDETTFNAFVLSALRAVQRCAPYTLPKERYDEWKSLRLNFDPSQMLN